MSLNDIVKELLNRKNKYKMKEKVEAIKDTYNESETEKEAIQNAADRIMQEIKSNPGMPIIEFLKMIQNEEKISNDIIIEATKQISDIKPEKTAVEIVKKIALPSKAILEIIKETDVSLEAAKKMAEEIPDEVIQKQERQRLEKIERERRELAKKKKETEIKKELREKYVTCEKIKGSDLIEDLKKIQRKSESKEINNIIKQVLARKAAIEWRRSGSTRIASMIQVIPPEEMLKEDFTKLVGEEFEEVKTKKEYQGPNDYNYQEEDLQNLILSEIAKKVAKVYNRVGIIDVPQSDKMKELTQEQEDRFVKKITKYVEDELKETLNVERIRRQVRGIQIDELDELRELVEKIPERERKDYIKTLKVLMQAGKEEPIDIEIETKLGHLRSELKSLKTDDAIEIIEDTRAEIKDRKIQRRKEIRQNNESKESDSRRDEEQQEK